MATLAGFAFFLVVAALLFNVFGLITGLASGAVQSDLEESRKRYREFPLDFH